MNKIIRRVMTLAFAGVFCLSLAGCGSDGNQSSGRDKITIWTSDSHSKDLVSKLVREYNENEGKELGVEVEYVVKGEDYSQALEMAITSGSTPDFFSTNQILKYSQNGVIVALNDLEGGMEYINTFSEDERYAVSSRFDGKMYGAPYQVTPQGLIYNKDMFKKYGIVDENGEPTPPKTFEEMREYAKKMTADGDYGMILPVKSGVFANYVQNMTVSAMGTDGFDAVNGKFDYTVYEPVMKCILDIKHDGSFYPGADGLDNDPARALFAEGKIGMFLGASYDVAVFTSQFPAKCEWGVAPYPVSDENNCYYQDSKISRYVVINKNTVDRIGAEKLLKVYKWFNGPKMLQELYKNGMVLPYSASVVKNVSLNEDIHPAWETFMEISDKYSMPLPQRMSTDLQGTPNLTTVLNNIWAEKESDMHSAFVDLSNRSNDGIAKAEAATPILTLDKYIIDSSYNRKR